MVATGLLQARCDDSRLSIRADALAEINDQLREGWESVVKVRSRAEPIHACTRVPLCYLI